MNTNKDLRNKAIELRKLGRSFLDIQNEIGSVPKSTLSFWLREISLPPELLVLRKKQNKEHLRRIRVIARQKKREQLSLFHVEQLQRNLHLPQMLKDKDAARIVLATLYMCEGTKSGRTRASIVFGNSDPALISLFLYLLRFCFGIDESKFRCTIQCRADQNTAELVQFWSSVTGIPKAQFYKSRIDPRSIGKTSKKTDYKGVCRIDYFSVRVFEEIVLIGKLLTTGL